MAGSTTEFGILVYIQFRSLINMNTLCCTEEGQENLLTIFPGRLMCPKNQRQEINHGLGLLRSIVLPVEKIGNRKADSTVQVAGLVLSGCGNIHGDASGDVLSRVSD